MNKYILFFLIYILGAFSGRAEGLYCCSYSMYGKQIRSMLSTVSVFDDKVIAEHITTPVYTFLFDSSSISNSFETEKNCIFSTVQNDEQSVNSKGVLEIDSNRICYKGKEGISIVLTPVYTKEPEIISGWFSPYMSKERKSYSDIQQRVTGKYGDYRASVKKGHKHAGVDLKGCFNEYIFPIGSGLVLFISNRPFNNTIIIQHITSKNDTLYSKYVHVEDIRVRPGDIVTVNDTLARIFNEKELRESRFDYQHVHLEIRKSYSDKGRASSYSMSLKELNMYCIDPQLFFKDNF